MTYARSAADRVCIPIYTAILRNPVESSTVLGMTTQGYVNLSIKPEAKRALDLLALDLSKAWGRRVSMSEALIEVTTAVYVNETEIPDPRK